VLIKTPNKLNHSPPSSFGLWRDAVGATLRI